MLVFLLLFEIAIILIIVLCHIMLEQKYKLIEKSTHIYTNKRAYRTQQSVAFVDDILKRYHQCSSQGNEALDLYSMIKSSLVKEYIGKFTFIGINNVAHKAKYIMWGIIALEMAIGYINNVATSLEGIVVIISSILLAIGVEIFILIKALEEKKEATIVLLEDYILNEYPLQVNKRVKNDHTKERKVLEEGQVKEIILLAKVQKKTSSPIALDNQKGKKEEKEDSSIKIASKEKLTEEDIIGFINNLNNL